jgi:hypothetical protein
VSRGEFLSVAGRWKQHVALTRIDNILPPREFALATLMFYAGFATALEASIELADLSEDEAVRLLQALHVEIAQLTAIAQRTLMGGKPS